MALDPTLERFLKQDPAAFYALMEQVAAEKSFYSFVELMWPVVEPANPFIPNWHIGAICEHLQAVSMGQIDRLLMNVPPGSAKSLLSDVLWPAYEWGPANLPHMRYICTSYSASLTERDNIRFRQVITSDKYRALWGDKFSPSKDIFSTVKVGNDKTGWKLATSTGGVGTGERGDRVVVDDPHNVMDGESETMRKSTLQYFQEVLPTRVVNPKTSAFVVIMQRVHEEDVSGYILSKDIGYTHLMLPMEFDPDRKSIVFLPSQLTDPNPEEIPEPFFEDPRTEEGELLFPARFPREVVERDKKIMGPYATASQFQQMPSPRGGGIIKREYWRLYPEGGEETGADGKPLKRLEYPPMELIIASADTAYTEKKENDPSALVVLGVYRSEGLPRIMLMSAWDKHLEFRGPDTHRLPDEEDWEYMARAKKAWGLLEWVGYDCRRFNVDFLLIENKASGRTLSQEVARVYSDAKWVTTLIDPKGDKVARAYAVQHIFAEGMVYAPDRSWAEKAITQCENFPKGKHDDIVDAITQGIKWLRDTGWALRREEIRADEEFRDDYSRRHTPKPIYDV